MTKWIMSSVLLTQPKVKQHCSYLLAIVLRSSIFSSRRVSGDTPSKSKSPGRRKWLKICAKNVALLSAGLIASLLSFSASAAVKLNSAAPDFNVKDFDGKDRKLADFKDKWVVLEWSNKGCPYVRKFYDSGKMQELQASMLKLAKENNAQLEWVTVVSSAEGEQGYLTAKDAKEYIKNPVLDPKKQKAPKWEGTVMLLDPAGTMGNSYGAKTTPHMFVINPKGMLVYAGAIDDNPSQDSKVIAASNNYVKAALTAGFKGEKIAKNNTQPYGCSVKYKN